MQRFLFLAFVLCESTLRAEPVRPTFDLVAAAEVGDAARVRTLLDGGAPVDARGPRGRTALVQAAKNGWVEVARLLLDHGADVNSRTSNGCVALTFAASQGSLPMVDLLLSKGARQDLPCLTAGDDPLFAAVIGSHPEVVRQLVARGAPINYFGRRDLKDVSSSPLFAAVARGDIPMVELLLSLGADLEARNNEDETVLLKFVCGNDTAMIKFLLSKGANLAVTTSTGRTPLIAAASCGQVENVKLLLAKGADPSAAASRYVGGPLHRAIDFAREYHHSEVVAVLEALGAKAAGMERNEANERLNEKLASAVAARSYEAVELLLSRGANPQSEVMFGHPLLEAAVFNGNADIVRLLLDHGANIEASVERYPPLHLSVNGDNLDVTRLLLKRGANVNAVARDGHTALQRAEYRQNEVLAALLRDAGAVENPPGSKPMPSQFYRAVSEGKVEKARELIPHSDPNEIDDHGAPVLVIAAMQVRFHTRTAAEIVDLLLDAGADPNLPSRAGRTALMEVLNDKSLVRKLIALGADVNARDVFGNNLLYMAENSRDPELLEIFKAAGAKE